MTFRPILWIDSETLEEQAQSYLAEHLPSKTLPIDIEYLIENEGFDIRHIPNMWNTFGARALPVYYQGRPAVCIDEEHLDRYPEISRFTFSEELGHILFHEYVFKDCDSLEKAAERYDELTGSEIDTMDKNARHFGAAILMPCDLLIQDFKEFIAGQNMRAFENLDEALAWMAQLVHRKYRVTDLALYYRLKAKVFYEIKGELLKKLQG